MSASGPQASKHTPADIDSVPARGVGHRKSFRGHQTLHFKQDGREILKLLSDSDAETGADSDNEVSEALMRFTSRSSSVISPVDATIETGIFLTNFSASSLRSAEGMQKSSSIETSTNTTGTIIARSTTSEEDFQGLLYIDSNPALDRFSGFIRRLSKEFKSRSKIPPDLGNDSLDNEYERSAACLDEPLDWHQAVARSGD
ncbi:hypothetical protein C8R43DRAFT_951575 [Mycena crocata]|nr:hypothetical protein C8R43DRAFT_951575 [Mycena crocata]